MMRNFSKILSLVLVVVMLSTVLIGCSLIGIDTVKYRDTVAFTVGEGDNVENITIGRIMDLYTNNVYSNYTNIANGQMTEAQVLEQTMDSLFSQYSMVNAYKTAEGTPIYEANDNKYLDTNVDDIEYLTTAEAEFILSNLVYSIFTVLDDYVETYIEAEVGDLAVVIPETSREFAKNDDLAGMTYAEYILSESLDTTTVYEYFDDFYGFDGFDRYDIAIEGYVYANATEATGRIDAYNERLADAIEDEEGEQEAPVLTADQYIEWQSKAVEQFEKVTDANYGIDLLSYMLEQADYSVDGLLANKWNTMIAGSIEDDANLATILEGRYDILKNAFDTSFNQNQDSYIPFITSLGESSYIFDVPALYEDDFIFVKNLLIPFSEEQTADLDNMENILGGTESKEYKDYRTELVAGIVAKDFDNNEEEIEGLFTVAGGVISLAGELNTALPNDGTVTNDGFVALMERFNTDTASHTAEYDYVVYTGAPDSYQHPWVPEFVDAAKTAQQGGLGHYGIAVSDYGVHIVYYANDIEPWNAFDVDKIYDTASNEYRLFVNYYEGKVNQVANDAIEELNDAYLYGGKIVAQKGFDYFLKESTLEYDFEEATTKPE